MMRRFLVAGNMASEGLPRFEGIETQKRRHSVTNRIKSEGLPRFEGIETCNVSLDNHFLRSEGLPRFEGIETILLLIWTGIPCPVRRLAPI